VLCAIIRILNVYCARSSVGGSQADPQAQAFSIFCKKSTLIYLFATLAYCDFLTGLLGEGFGWANFDFGGGLDEEDEAASKRRQAAAISCSAVQEDLANWVDTFKAKGPVSKFLQRQLTCAALLVLLSAVRAAVRKAQMLYYPDEPPPGDMAWPGWEGPGEF